MGLALGFQLSVHLVAHEAVFVHPFEPLSGSGRAWACVLACFRVGISVSMTASPIEHGCGWGGPDQGEGGISLNLILPLEVITHDPPWAWTGTQQHGTVRTTPTPPSPPP